MTDTMTVIRSRHLRLAKRIHADGKIEAYDKAKTIDLFEMPIADLNAIGNLLARLLPQPSCAVVFGGVADPRRIRGVRRLAYPDPETGDLPSLRAIPHLWAALDMDSVPRSEGVAADDLLACGSEAVQRLPAAFHGARRIVQASASHGINVEFHQELTLPPTKFPLRTDPCFDLTPAVFSGGTGVIDMELLSVIRRWAFRDRLSIREISRRTSLSRNTTANICGPMLWSRRSRFLIVQASWMHLLTSCLPG